MLIYISIHLTLKNFTDVQVPEHLSPTYLTLYFPPHTLPSISHPTKPLLAPTGTCCKALHLLSRDSASPQSRCVGLAGREENGIGPEDEQCFVKQLPLFRFLQGLPENRQYHLIRARK